MIWPILMLFHHSQGTVRKYNRTNIRGVFYLFENFYLMLFGLYVKIKTKF